MGKGLIADFSRFTSVQMIAVIPCLSLACRQVPSMKQSSWYRDSTDYPNSFYTPGSYWVQFFCQHVECSLGEGNGTPLQYSCLENPMDGGAWQAAVHGVAKSQTRLSDFTFNFHFHALEKEMATHSSVLAWRIPGTGEPGGLLSMGSHRVRHD